MHKHRELTEERIRQVLARSALLIHRPTAPLSIAAFHVRGEPIPATEVLRGSYRPFAAGDAWGTR